MPQGESSLVRIWKQHDALYVQLPRRDLATRKGHVPEDAESVLTGNNLGRP
jgi:hypothetical protein